MSDEYDKLLKAGMGSGLSGNASGDVGIAVHRQYDKAIRAKKDLAAVRKAMLYTARSRGDKVANERDSAWQRQHVDRQVAARKRHPKA